MARSSRVMMNFEVTVREAKMIERAAKRGKQSVSAYLREAVYIERMLALDREAYAMVGRAVPGALAAKLKEFGFHNFFGHGTLKPR